MVPPAPLIECFTPTSYCPLTIDSAAMGATVPRGRRPLPLHFADPPAIVFLLLPGAPSLFLPPIASPRWT
jgi:hypothetical protein